MTSVAESGRYTRAPELWVSNNGRRSKESFSCLFKVCPENEAVFAELKRLEEERQRVEKETQATRGKLIHIELSNGESGDDD